MHFLSICCVISCLVAPYIESWNTSKATISFTWQLEMRFVLCYDARFLNTDKNILSVAYVSEHRENPHTLLNTYNLHSRRANIQRGCTNRLGLIFNQLRQMRPTGMESNWRLYWAQYFVQATGPANTWFGEIYSCSCLALLPRSALVLLNKTCIV